MDLANMDPLDDIFNPAESIGLGTSRKSQPAPASGARAGMPLDDFDFDPNFDPNMPVVKTDVEKPAPIANRQSTLPAPVASERPAPREPREPPPPHAPVDKDELRKRITGAGSEKPSLGQRARGFFQAGIDRGQDYVAGRLSEHPRWKTFVALLVVLIAVGGCAWYLHGTRLGSRQSQVAAASLPSDDDVSGSGIASKASDSLGNKDSDAAKDDNDKQEPGSSSDDDGDSSAGRESSTRKASKSQDKDLVALRRTVVEGDRAIQNELQSLRQDVKRLLDQLAGSSSAKTQGRSRRQPEAESSSSGYSSEEQQKSPDADAGVGQVRSEPTQAPRPSRRSRPRVTTTQEPELEGAEEGDDTPEGEARPEATARDDSRASSGRRRVGEVFP